MRHDPQTSSITMSKTTQSSKKRKSADKDLDIAYDLDILPGQRLQVKWTIRDDDPNSTSTSVWWSATLQARTSQTHTLTAEERDEVELEGGDDNKVTLPIYELDYDPLPAMGFAERAVEQVAFTSDRTLLNLSTEEIMLYRREGESSPPESQAGSDTEEEVDRHLTAEGISNLMDEIMNKSLVKSGLGDKLERLPMDKRQKFAEKMKEAKDKLFEKLMGEMDRVSGEGGDKVITGDVVKKCLSEMD